MAWGTPGHVGVIRVVTTHFCEAHDSNLATSRLANMTKSKTPTNAPRPQEANRLTPGVYLSNILICKYKFFQDSFKIMSSLVKLDYH